MKISARRTYTCLAVAVGGLALASGVHAGDDTMQTMDTNKDGMISAAEHTAGTKAKFGKLDADGDGRVTAAEMDAAHSGAGGSAAPAMSSAEKIKTMDTDGDGAITAAEHEKGARGMFNKMDANGDGNLSAEEMQAGHHQKPMTEQPR
jgi:Ca2+-binding EF-hand superfamily protein